MYCFIHQSTKVKSISDKHSQQEKDTLENLVGLPAEHLH